MYIVEHLPKAGTRIAYQLGYGYGAWHYAVIQNGILKAACGMRGQFPNAANIVFGIRLLNPNKDNFRIWTDYLKSDPNRKIPIQTCAKCIPFKNR